MYTAYVKRTLDFLLSAAALLLFSWLFLILAVLVRVTSPGPVFFKQKRIGIRRGHFNMLKFRTMRMDTPKDVPTHMLEHPEQYITAVGRFLRRTSLDELPQLFNIIAGHMAIVGPRPALWNQEDLIREREQYGANDVRPGLTGWAQINGRDEIEIPLKARYDGEYVKRMGLWFDLKIIAGTALSVLGHDGVKEGGTGDGKGNGR